MSETQPSRPDLNTRPAEPRPAKVRVIAPESKLVIDPLENERAADFL